MSDQVFQVRWRGKVSGPFSVVLLKEMLAKGEVSLLHETLIDGRWVPLEQLSAVCDSENSLPKPTPPPSVAKPMLPKTSGPPPMPPEELYHVAKHGRPQGPYPKSALKQLVSAGILDAEDPAWAEGMPGWRPLKEIVELGSHYPAALPPTSTPIPLAKSASGAHERPSNHLAAGMAAFAWYHSHEVRKELHEINENLQELQEDSGAEDVPDGGSWDVSDM